MKITNNNENAPKQLLFRMDCVYGIFCFRRNTSEQLGNTRAIHSKRM